jgi:hypothetical protein
LFTKEEDNPTCMKVDSSCLVYKALAFVENEFGLETKFSKLVFPLNLAV